MSIGSRFREISNLINIQTRLNECNAKRKREVGYEQYVSNPFIPIAWQKEHKGMQGIEYLTGEEKQECINLWLESAELALNHAEKM